MADYRVASWGDCFGCGRKVVTVRTVGTSHRIPTKVIPFDCPRCGASGAVGVMTTWRGRAVAAVYSPLFTPPWVWALMAFNKLSGDS